MPQFADRVVAFLEAIEATYAGHDDTEEMHPVSPELVALLDTSFVEWVPCAARLLELLEERGFTGWTDIRRIDPRD